jgi:Conserved TM helix
MDDWSQRLQPVLAALGPWAMRLGGTLAIALAAWVVARLVRSAVTRAAGKAGLDERLHSPGIGATLAGVASALVWLFALPAILGALQMEALLTPVNAMMSRLMGFVPNLFGSVVVLAVGVLLGRIVKQIVSGLLLAAGSEKLAARLGLVQALGDNTLAGLAGSALFALILLPTLVAALQPLGLDAVTQPVSKLLETVISMIPKLIAAGLIVVIAAVVGRTLANLVATLLAGMGFDKLPVKIGLAREGEKIPGGRSASELAGNLVMGAVLLVAAVQASEVMGLPVLTETVSSLGGALARVLAGVLVLLVGLWLATGAARAIQASSLVNAGAVALAARAAILFFAAALALRQAGLPADIVAIAFGAVVGSLAIGVAIALGIGGRGVAERLLDAAVARFERPDGARTPPAVVESTDPAAPR